RIVVANREGAAVRVGGSVIVMDESVFQKFAIESKSISFGLISISAPLREVIGLRTKRTDEEMGDLLQSAAVRESLDVISEFLACRVYGSDMILQNRQHAVKAVNYLRGIVQAREIAEP